MENYWVIGPIDKIGPKGSIELDGAHVPGTGSGAALELFPFPTIGDVMGPSQKSWGLTKGS